MTGPRYLHFQITEQCNLNCPGCYLPTRGWTPWASLEAIVEIVFKPLATAGVRYVTLTGGEPLLHPDCVAICEAACRYFSNVQLVCNGTLLDIPTYKALRDAGIKEIKISLDGLTSGVHDRLRGRTGTFEKVVGNLKSIISLPGIDRGEINIGCICTISPENVNVLTGIADFVKGLGMDSMLFQPFHPYGLLYPSQAKSTAAHPHARKDFITTLDGQVAGLKEIRKRYPGFLDNSLAMLDKLKSFYLEPDGPEQICGSDRFVFIDSSFNIRGCLFCHPLGSLKDQSMTKFREKNQWKRFDKFRSKCRRCLMGCQFVDQSKDYVEEGFALLDSGKPDLAQELFDNSLKLEYSVEAAHGAGLARFRQGELESAQKFFEDALQHKPRNLYILWDLGSVFLQQGQYDRAADMANSILTISPKHTMGYRLSGLVARHKGDLNQAVSMLREAIEADQNNDQWILFDYGLVCLEAQHFATAEKYIRMAIELDSEFPWYHYRLAMALQGLGQKNNAIEVCTKAIRLDPDQEQFQKFLLELNCM
nr:tetratricopeptide repeat protein [uncultured Desulfobacter sp.]